MELLSFFFKFNETTAFLLKNSKKLLGVPFKLDETTAMPL